MVVLFTSDTLDRDKTNCFFVFWRLKSYNFNDDGEIHVSRYKWHYYLSYCSTNWKSSKTTFSYKYLFLTFSDDKYNGFFDSTGYRKDLGRIIWWTETNILTLSSSEHRLNRCIHELRPPSLNLDYSKKYYTYNQYEIMVCQRPFGVSPISEL